MHAKDEPDRERAAEAARRALAARDGRPLPEQLRLTRLALRYIAGNSRAGAPR